MTAREEVLLGALLHDIGKFWQRTDNPPTDLTNRTRHQVWSDRFFLDYVPADYHGARTAALHHHDPGYDVAAEIVQEADRIAAGLDRERRDADQKGRPSEEPLEADLSRVRLGKAEKPQPRRWSYPLRALSLNREDCFPREEQTLDAPQYRKLWSAFTAELKRLPPRPFSSYLTSLNFLLWKYTWCIPSAVYADYPNVPLYDHSRVTAAIADCLTRQQDWKQGRFLLIQGEIGRIQSFLYSPTFRDPESEEASKGIAQRVRGRSTFVWLFCETVVDYLAEKLGLSSLAALWVAGGHFLLLAPDNEEASSQLKQARERIAAASREQTNAQLEVYLAATPTTADELRTEFGKALARASNDMAEAKCRKGVQEFGRPEQWRTELSERFCELCGADSRTSPCELCSKLRELGRRIVHARRLGLRRRAGGEDDLANFAALGRSWFLADEFPREACDLLLSIADNDNPLIEFLPRATDREPAACACGFRLLCTAAPRWEGARQLLSFDELADASRRGRPQLGFLRMDVDNLGAIFHIGLPHSANTAASRRSLSRLAGLSRTLDWFFSGYVNRLLENQPIYTCYSGGDDLFLVGAWDAAVEQAAHIRREFSEYCGNNPDVGLSAGVSFVATRFPFGQAAEMARCALDEQAKALVGKNAISLLNVPLTWRKWSELKQFVEACLLDGAGLRSGIHRSFLSNLLGWAMAAGGEKENLIWTARLKYSCSRNIKDEKLRGQVFNFIAQNWEFVPAFIGYALLATRPRSDSTRERNHE